MDLRLFKIWGAMVCSKSECIWTFIKLRVRYMAHLYNPGGSQYKVFRDYGVVYKCRIVYSSIFIYVFIMQVYNYMFTTQIKSDKMLEILEMLERP